MVYPELTPDQLKRFRQFLVDVRFAKSQTDARKMTPDKKSCHEVFLKLMQHVHAGCPYDIVEQLMLPIADVCDLYVVDDDLPEPLVTKLDQLGPEPKELLVTKPEPEQPESKPKEVVKRVRGGGKKPKKSTFLVAFEPIQLDRLKQLGGNVSNHIRAAVDYYLDLKRIGEKPEGGDDG